MEKQSTTPLASKTATALRPLGAVEQYFWLSDQNSPKHFAMTLQVSGETTIDCWREAMDAVRVRHPLLRAMIARDILGVPTYYELSAQPLPLRVITAEAPHDWEAAVSEELMNPFPIAGVPLARATLFHSRNFCTLVFTAHHAVADGMSVAFVLRDLLTVLGGGSLPSLQLAAAQDMIAAQWAPQADVSDAAPPPAPRRMLDRTGTMPVVSALRLSGELTSSVRATARRHGTTVHGAVLAAVILAGRRLDGDWGERPVRAISPVNLRGVLGLEDDCVVSIVFPASDYDPAGRTSIWELAAAIKTDLAETKSRRGVLGTFGVFKQIMATSPGVSDIARIELQACACDMMLSNLGEAPFKATYGSVRLEALWGPSVFAGIEGEQMIGAATVNGRLHLLHTSFTPIRSLLQTASELLEEAIAE
ncbi:condensation domain-containing protein [Rhizobium sp. BK251]|uniref:condensation domain-containing protein n=1 Tax=Rhizobium sp. BK251 TaxID=2512125 RepID=UPI001043BDBE|nr:condensation domain-containing protein [Rhizobium sp. BK251]TCL73022.1 condensation domain-containing protein [Rhizobium sp. BK251]